MQKLLENIRKYLNSKSPHYIKVKVLPKSPKNEITDQLEDGTFKIRIKAPATDGKANAELIKFLKKGLKASEVEIISGQKDRVKLIRINV